MALKSQPLTDRTYNESEIENWFVQLRKGDLDENKLKQMWSQCLVVYGNHPMETVLEQTGIVIIKCDRCSHVAFSVHTIGAYSGAYNICSNCSKYYSVCKECHCYILTTDLNNPTHTHIKYVAPGNDYLTSQFEVEPWNADIMQISKGASTFKKTDAEFKIWKHQKESSYSIRSKLVEAGFRYFGVELEVEKFSGGPTDLVSRTAKVLKDYAILKHDGSLSLKGKGGFEIVTVPATLAYHKSGVWDFFFDNLAMFFYDQPPTTGLHVHIAVDTLGEMTAAKMISFVNNKSNKEFIESIASRELNTPNPNGKVYAGLNHHWKMSDILKFRQHSPLCPWNPKNKNSAVQYKISQGAVQTDPAGNPIIASIKATPIIVRPTCKCSPGLYHLEKYEAFNLMTKRPTVEIRIFRGIVDKRFIYSALEFGDALADFCAETSPANIYYRDFLNWLCRLNDSGRTKLYPNLSRYLINKGWIDPAKLSLRPEIRVAV